MSFQQINVKLISFYLKKTHGKAHFLFFVLFFRNGQDEGEEGINFRQFVSVLARFRRGEEGKFKLNSNEHKLDCKSSFHLLLSCPQGLVNLHMIFIYRPNIHRAI